MAVPARMFESLRDLRGREGITTANRVAFLDEIRRLAACNVGGIRSVNIFVALNVHSVAIVLVFIIFKLLIIIIAITETSSESSNAP